jgi:hypothetical protein
MWRHPRVVCVAALLGGMLVAADATAQHNDGRFRLMTEPTSFTDVIDAFDDDDPFDVNMRVGYRHERSWGTIQRETLFPGTGDAPGTYRPASVATYRHQRNILDLQLDVGLYRDVALYVKLPVILSDDRSLRLKGDRASVEQVLSSPDGMGGRELLFDPDFDAPTRSGIDQIAVGLAWAISNQARTPHLPTWVVMAEGLFNVGDVMRACDASTDYGDTRCNGGDNPGISRGTMGIQAETRASKRYNVVEPYMGLLFKMEWAVAASDSFTGGAGNLAGFMNTRPPVEGELTLGMAFVPWERLDRFQRLTIDVRGSARYISEGRGYSPLFDALGTSTSTFLRAPNVEGTNLADGRSVHYFGLSDIEAHGRYGGRLTVDVRAHEYLQFLVGAGLFYTTPHLITATDACNPNVSTNELRGTGRRGECSQGIINPHHRSVVDTPGNRFQLNGLWTMDFMVSAIARF